MSPGVPVRYGAEAIARLPAIEAETLYVVGGLYGNLPALDAIEAMASQEDGPLTLAFKHDFNGFNVDDTCFSGIWVTPGVGNRAVLRLRASRLN